MKNSEVVEGILMFYDWKNGDSPTAKAFLLHGLSQQSTEPHVF